MIERVLVANRGEIAARICREARELGMESVAVHAADDARQPHVRLADHAVPLGQGPPGETYLDAAGLVERAVETGCDAVHPGYGFLSEDASFARRVEGAGLTWVGPPPGALELLGDKARALDLAAQLGAPTTPGSDGEVSSLDQARSAIEAVGLPAVLKAVHGGGGMGMVTVRDLDELEDAWAQAREQAQAAFGSPKVLVERWWDKPRHVEVQVAFDGHGNGVHLFERECSLQRRNQKLVEEAPAPCVDGALREALARDALRIAQAADLENLATVEFLVLGDKGPGGDRAREASRYVFNEVNPRLQVEHPVTEAVTGQNLVEWQLRIADGQRLPAAQSDLSIDGWAIEARVNVEDPLDGFQPSPGPVDEVHVPDRPGIRVDHALVPGSRTSARYDSLVAKVIGSGPNRSRAIDRCRAALAELRVGGRPTTAGFLHWLLDRPGVREGRMHTGLVDEEVTRAYRQRVLGAMAAMVHETPVGQAGTVELDGHVAAYERSDGTVEVGGEAISPTGRVVSPGEVDLGDRRLRGRVRPSIATRAAGVGEGQSVIESPLAGLIEEVRVQPGDEIEAGDVVLVLEAMKMKNRVATETAGVVDAVLVEAGQNVDRGASLVRIETGTPP